MAISTGSAPRSSSSISSAALIPGRARSRAVRAACSRSGARRRSAPGPRRRSAPWGVRPAPAMRSPSRRPTAGSVRSRFSPRTGARCPGRTICAARASRGAPRSRRRACDGAESVTSARSASPSREAAARVLERVETDASFADEALEAELTRRRLEPRDAALATELAYGTLRWQRYLDWILAPHSRRRLEALDARVRVLLRMTAYQIAFLERVPAFAAVNDAVTLAPRAPGVKIGRAHV